LTDEASPELRIGRIAKAHGLRGALRIESLTDFPDRFAPGAEVTVDGRTLRVKSSEENDGGLLVRFEGIEDRNAAEELAGQYCTVPLASARTLPDNQYYHFELVGLSVYDSRHQRELGRVEEILTYAANDVLRVSNGRVDTLIPMVKHIVKTIDRASGRITVELPEEVEA
jgi:16S rRNA processing protein RimM